MSATHATDPTTATAPVLYLALELSWTSWKLAFTVGAGQKPRLRSIAARDIRTLMLEVDKAKRRFGLPEGAPVLSCYEAGRDGFWLHRYLRHQGVENLVVDAASIEVNRRRRRAKADNIDATKLVGMLNRWHLGERKLWGVVWVPAVADEDRRQLQRELIEPKARCTEHTNRIKGLLAGLGLAARIDAEFLQRLDGLRQWDGTELPTGLRRRILREYECWMAGLLQTHLSHPVLSFDRARHWGQSWLLPLTIILDSSALMVASGDGIAGEQARLTYRMGLHLLRDLTDALGLTIDPQCRGRLTEDQVPALLAALKASGDPWTPGPRETAQLLRLVHRYEVYLMPLSERLVIPLPGWVPSPDEELDAEDAGELERADESL
jgi:hypothetical protein